MQRTSKSKKNRSSCRCGQNVAHLDMKKDQKKPELIEKNGHTYGTFAAKAGCIKCVESLIQCHIDPNLSQNHNGSTMLHYAALNGRPNVVNLLCENGAEVNQANKRIRTALHEAATTGNQEVVKVLLSYGANVMNKNKYGRTSLHIATKYENYKVRDLLVEHRQLELKSVLREINSNLSFGVNIYESLVQLIVEFTCNTAKQDDVCFCAQDLEDNDIQIDFKIPHNEHGHTVATKSAVSGCVKCCNWLIKCGLDINLPVTNDGSTMLYCAVYKQRIACVRLLCEKNADVNVSNYRERLPLRCAVNNDKEEIVQLLLESNADLAPLGNISASSGVQEIIEFHTEYRFLISELSNFVIDHAGIIDGEENWIKVKIRFMRGIGDIIGNRIFMSSLSRERIDAKMPGRLDAFVKSSLNNLQNTHKNQFPTGWAVQSEKPTGNIDHN